MVKDTRTSAGRHSSLAPTSSDANRTTSEQELLDFLAKHYRETLLSPNFEKVLQRIKGYFYDRLYDSVFLHEETATVGTSSDGKDLDQLSVYAARFVPARALIYRQLILGIKDFDRVHQVIRREGRKIVCIGAGAGSEWLAFVNLSSHLVSSDRPSGLQLQILDYADWHESLCRLSRDYFDHFEQRKGTNAERAYVRWNFEQHDVLKQGIHPSFAHADLITILFTLNELFAQSKAKTMAFLRGLISAMPIGCLLLVVESSGSFSTLQINGNAYAVWQILDNLKGFKTVASEDSHWSRLDKSLKYPLPLESSRHFYRLYERFVEED